MGDPGYNTRGGKHNKWGRKQKKQTHYEENKVFKVFVGVVVGLALMSGIGQAISGLYDSTIGKAKDTIKISKDIADLGKSTSTGDTTVRNDAATKLEDDAIDIIKDKLKDSLLERNLPESISTITVIDYEKVEDTKGYTKNIVNKVEDGTHTFAIIMTGHLTNEIVLEKTDNIKELLQETGSLAEEHSYIHTDGIANIPFSGNYTMLVTYIAD